MSQPVPSLDAVRTANAARMAEHAQPLVAVFTGGTSGIGEYTIHALARHAAVANGAAIYIVGRSESAALKIAADHADSKNVSFRFIHADDLSLIKDVDRCCQELSSLLHEDQRSRNEAVHIDLLVMSHADLWLGARRDTSEGLDKLFSLLYYSRIRFITQLLPLLEATPLSSARVISVYGAGLETPNRNLYVHDLALHNPKNFSFTATRNHVVYMKTMAFETLAQQHPKLGLVHVFPGLVITPGFDRNPMPKWFKILWPIVAPVAGLFALAEDDIAEWILGFNSDRFGGTQQTTDAKEEAAGSTDGVAGGGAYSAKYNGQVYSPVAGYDRLRPEAFKTKVWDHTMSVFKTIEEGRVFEQ